MWVAASTHYNGSPLTHGEFSRLCSGLGAGRETDEERLSGRLGRKRKKGTTKDITSAIHCDTHPECGARTNGGTSQSWHREWPLEEQRSGEKKERSAGCPNTVIIRKPSF